MLSDHAFDLGQCTAVVPLQEAIMTDAATDRSGETPANTPFEALGGAAAIRRIVDSFYDLMETDPQYAKLRALHAADLSPMRDSLAGYLAAWSGGPRTWFQTRPVTCIMSIHRKIPIDRETASQWTDAMQRALANAGTPRPISEAMHEILVRMATGMIRG